MKGWEGYPQFDSDKGCGRVALLACVLSTILGINFILCLQLVLIRLGILSADIFGSYWTDDTLQMALQWTVYVQVLCIFHLGEFFTTAICNPSVTSADSFMVRMRLFWFAKANIKQTFPTNVISYASFAGKSLEGIYRSSIGEYIWYYVIYDRQDEHLKENNT